jgi:hypothetical protein
VEFEWDPEKAAANVKKHGVEFAEAMTIFGDPLELTIADPDHSGDEPRFLSIGLSAGRSASRGGLDRAHGSNANHQRSRSEQPRAQEL